MKVKLIDVKLSVVQLNILIIYLVFQRTTHPTHCESEYCYRIKNSENLKNILDLPKMKLHKKTSMGAGRLLSHL